VTCSNFRVTQMFLFHPLSQEYHTSVNTTLFLMLEILIMWSWSEPFLQKLGCYPLLVCCMIFNHDCFFFQIVQLKRFISISSDFSATISSQEPFLQRLDSYRFFLLCMFFNFIFHLLPNHSIETMHFYFSELPSNQLIGTLPTVIGQLSSLQWLYVLYFDCFSSKSWI